jgi:hypothetical protein
MTLMVGLHHFFRNVSEIVPIQAVDEKRLNP